MANVVNTNQQPVFNPETKMEVPSFEMKGVNEIANETLQKSLKEQPKQSVQQPQQDTKPVTTNAELFARLNEDKRPLTEEEKAAEAKRQKRDKIFAAIGDGISALSNMYFASKGAKSSFDPSQSMTAKQQARLDMLRKEREGREREWREGYMKAVALDNTIAENREKRRLTERQLDDNWKRFELDQERRNKEHTDKVNQFKQQQDLKQQHHQEEMNLRKWIAKYNQGNANYRAGLGSTATTSVGKDENGNPVKIVETRKVNTKSSGKGSGYGKGGGKGKGY